MAAGSCAAAAAASESSSADHRSRHRATRHGRERSTTMTISAVPNMSPDKATSKPRRWHDELLENDQQFTVASFELASNRAFILSGFRRMS